MIQREDGHLLDAGASSIVTNADFCLDVARRELKRLVASTGRIRLGSAGYSAHFRHAVICSVFSAFAVEHALAELIWARCFFQTPEPYRRIALQHAAGLRTIPAKLGFIQATTRIPAELIADMKSVFEYRNRIAHCRIKTFEGRVIDVDEILEGTAEGDAATYQQMSHLLVEKEARYLQLPGLSTEDLDMAEENLRIAERAVQALRLEMESPDWLPVTPTEVLGSVLGSDYSQR